MDYLERCLFFFAVVSSAVLGILSIFSVAMNNCVSLVKNTFAQKEDFMKKITFVLGLEMFCEDIPQVILTYMVMRERNGGVWSPVGVFNLTTSMFNFTFNILDMMIPLDEEVHHDENKQQQMQEKYQQHDTGMAVEDDAKLGGDGGLYYALPPVEPQCSTLGASISPEEQGAVFAEERKDKEAYLIQSHSTTSAGFDQLKERILSEDHKNNLQGINLPLNIPSNDDGYIVCDEA